MIVHYCTLEAKFLTNQIPQEKSFTFFQTTFVYSRKTINDMYKFRKTIWLIEESQTKPQIFKTYHHHHPKSGATLRGAVKKDVTDWLMMTMRLLYTRIYSFCPDDGGHCARASQRKAKHARTPIIMCVQYNCNPFPTSQKAAVNTLSSLRVARWDAFDAWWPFALNT